MVVSFAPNFLKYRPHRVNINSLRFRVSSLRPPSNKISVLKNFSSCKHSIEKKDSSLGKSGQDRDDIS